MIMITDEQKRMIESQGFMVVEFKLWCKKLQFVMADAIHRLYDVCNAVILFLQDKMLKAFESIHSLAERINMESKPCIYREHRARANYPFIKKLGNKYKCDYVSVTIYHCRNNC